MNAMWTRVFALLVKELLAIFNDPKGRVVLIAPPLIQLFLFTFAVTQEPRNRTFATLNQDGGRWGHELIQRFRAASVFSTVFALDGTQQIADTLDRQRAVGVLVVPQDFSRRIAAGGTADAHLLLDGRRTNTGQIVGGYAQRILTAFNADVSGGASRPPTLVVSNWFNPNLTFQWYTVPSLVCILATLIGVLVTALSVARERETGTFEQLLVSPLRPAEILAGKAAAALLVAMAEATLILVAARLVFRMPFTGSLLLLYASMTVFLLAVIGIGLFISALSMTQQQAILGSFVFMTPAMLLSGFATPIENMPEFFQTLTLANPVRWFLVIVHGLFLKAMPPEEIWANTWPMALIAAATLSAASWRFRRGNR
jgi:ABC-2 type transport system permease protein